MQVHEIVDLVTSDEPPLRYDTDSIVNAGRRRQRRRRAGWAGAGVFATVALVMGATAGVSALTDNHPATAPQVAAASPAPTLAAVAQFPAPADPFTFTFAGYDAGKFHVQNPIDASGAYQIASVYETGRVTNDHSVTPPKNPPVQATPMLYGYLTLYRPGAFNPNGIVGGHRTTVDGHEAVAASGPGETADITHVTLAWKYTNNVWAVVDTFSNSYTDPSAQDLTQLVNGLQPSTPVPAAVPFRTSYLPAGYKLIETGTQAMPGLNGIAFARGGDYGGAIFAKPALPTTGLTQPYGGVDGADLPGSFEIFVVPNGNSNQRLKNGQTPPAEPVCEHGFCNLWNADGSVQIQVSSGGRLSNSEMSKIAKGVHLADVKNPSTWPAASTALKP